MINELKGEYKEEFLLSLLIAEKNDYEMLQEMLLPARTISSIREQVSGVSNVLKRLYTASEMARERKDADGLLKWSLCIAVIKAYFGNAIDYSEVEALIAIGRSEDALRKAYSFSDLPSRIRLIAKTYSSMQDQDEHISNAKKEELQTFVEGLNIHETEIDLLQRIAIDLFPVLPDVALNLLEKLQVNEEQKSIVDVAANTIVANYKNLNDQSIISTGEDSRTSFDLYRSRWIAKATFSELKKNISKIESVKAKEQYIRHWCRRNQNDNNLHEAINLWLDTVVDDRSFVIPLLYLRQICELLLSIDMGSRRLLVNRLRVPKFTALSSPKEEWIRVHLSLAESIFDIDTSEAQREVLTISEPTFRSEKWG